MRLGDLLLGARGEPVRLVQYWDKPVPPPEVAALIDRWRRAPGLSHRLYDREAALAEVEAKLGPRYAGALARCAVPAMQADYFRYATLFAQGGLWVDTDYAMGWRRLFRPLGRVRAGFVIAREDRENGLVLGNDVLFFRSAGHPLLGHVLEKATRNIESGLERSVWWTTGPQLFRDARDNSATAPLFDGLDRVTRRDLRHYLRARDDLAYKATDVDWRAWKKSGRSIFS